MTPESVSATRIMLRDRGTVSDLTVQGELIIRPDDPEADAMIQPVTESIRISTLPKRVQDAIQLIYAEVQNRLEKQHGVIR